MGIERLFAGVHFRHQEAALHVGQRNEDLPVKTIVYPVARYSPEYQALVWAKENKATVRFIRRCWAL